MAITLVHGEKETEEEEEVESPVSPPGQKPLPVASKHMSEPLVSSEKQPILVDTVQSTRGQLPSVAFTEKAREGDAHAGDATHTEDLILFEETWQKGSPV